MIPVNLLHPLLPNSTSTLKYCHFVSVEFFIGAWVALASSRHLLLNK